MKNRQLMLAAFAITALATGCNQSNNANENTVGTTNAASTMENIKEGVTNAWQQTKEVTTNAALQAWTDIKDSLSSTKNYTYEEKNEFVTNAQADLAALDEKVQVLSNKVATASDSVKADAQTKLQDLSSQRAALDQKLDAVKNATQDKWDNAKTDFKNAYDQVKNSLKQAWQWLKNKSS